MRRKADQRVLVAGGVLDDDAGLDGGAGLRGRAGHGAKVDAGEDNADELHAMADGGTWRIWTDSRAGRRLGVEVEEALGAAAANVGALLVAGDRGAPARQQHRGGAGDKEEARPRVRAGEGRVEVAMELRDRSRGGRRNLDWGRMR